jgi:hypothetical protein
VRRIRIEQRQQGQPEGEVAAVVICWTVASSTSASVLPLPLTGTGRPARQTCWTANGVILVRSCARPPIRTAKVRRRGRAGGQFLRSAPFGRSSYCDERRPEQALSGCLPRRDCAGLCSREDALSDAPVSETSAPEEVENGGH